MKSLFPCLLLVLAMLPALARADIRFTASIPQGVHRLSDRLPIEIRVENTGEEPVYVYGNLNFFIYLFAFSSDGKGIPPDFIRETMSPPPAKDSFTRIEPGHFLGTVWKQDLKSLGIHAPGSYRLSLNYRSTFSPTFSFGLPIWTGRKSASIQIEISK